MVGAQGKTVVITGANSGIGRVTALELARSGARVVLVCRNEARGTEAVTAIREATGSERVELALCDLSQQAEVHRVAGDLISRLDRLDILINNAGAYIAEHRLTGDGLEMSFALNHMGYFLLTRLLLDLLKESAPSRIISVTSEGHRMGNIQWDDLHWERRRYKALKCYCDSKLMNILFTSALALRLKGSGVTANCLHPGAVRSGFAIGQGDFFSRIVRLGGLFLLSPERGAETSLYLATSSEVAETSGAYFARCRPKKPSALARDAHLAERLWEISEQSLRSLDTLPSQ